MSETATRLSAFAGLTLPAVRNRLSVTVAPDAIRYSLRGSPAAAAALGAVFGPVPSTTACRATSAGDRAALWLGPDEWYLLAPDGDAAALAASLSAAIDEPHALVDISHRNVGLILKGPRAADVLNGACPLDLSETAFPVGMSTRTLYAKAEIILWRTGLDTFRVEFWRSFAGYIVGLIAENAREHAV
ncbi:MAG: sarcosine oxidase subunit gamma [Hyphomicrobiaceae bacterium]|nr:sarcosine oxidase subunit gamma [Hyphomicrobiaceae bacterium]